jgi:hypothetical protein
MKKQKNQYRSKFEQKIADQLTKKKIKFLYEPENIKYVMPESKHNYKPDFKLPNGIYIETKGKWDSDSRKKMALVKEQHPEIDIRILFMRDQPIRKGSSTMYSDVCKKLGYQYAFKEIPTEWLGQTK